MRRGFTVIEMLVVTVLLGFILTAMLSFLMPGFKAWSTGDHHATLEQDGTLAVLSLSKEVAQIPIETTIIVTATRMDPLLNAMTETDTLSFVSPLDLNDNIAFESDGAPFLSRFVRYSVDDQWRLVAWYGYLPGNQYFNTNTIRLDYPNYDIKSGNTWTQKPFVMQQTRVIARNVHRFSCQVASQPVQIMGQQIPTDPIHIDLLMKDQQYAHEIQTDVSSVVGIR